LRRHFVRGLEANQINALWHCAPLLRAAWLAGIVGGLAVLASTQQRPAGGQEGAQQDQNMTSEQRAASTRAFLGLGAVPDKTAAMRGAPLFVQNCGACHGKDARGAMGPSLITSDLVLTDEHGHQLVAFLTKGRPEKGMPAFRTLSHQQMTDIAEFLHLQVENVANRGAYKMLNILVGNVPKGKAYVQAGCMSCHKAETFAHIASKFRTPEQLQRSWIWPAREGKLTAKVKTLDGTFSGWLKQISDFRVTLVDRSGETHTIDRGPGVDVQISDQLAGHQEIIMTLSNDDMHDVTAYLETLK
jgi:cytochrome c oxidase cbb3-type subunit III